MRNIAHQLMGFFYWRCYTQCMKKILIAVDAPGPAEFIAPVLPLLKNSELDLKIVTVKDSPTKILEKYNPLRCDTEADAEKIYQEFNPDVLLVATSSLQFGPFVNKKFTELAHHDKKQIICFQDFWGNHRWPQNREVMQYWQAILVPDGLAKKLLLEDGYQNKIIVTGSPAFDKFKNINVTAERKRLRELFKIPQNAFVILHAGTGTPQSAEADEITFKFVAQTFREFKTTTLTLNPILIARAHPRDEQSDRYQKLAPDLELLDTNSIALSDELLPIADAVIAMYSTNLIHACYLYIPAISILLPDAGRKRLSAINLSDFPPNQFGATIGIYDPEIPKLTKIMEKIKNDVRFRSEIRTAQEKYFPLPKELAAEKVANVIEYLLK